MNYTTSDCAHQSPCVVDRAAIGILTDEANLAFNPATQGWRRWGAQGGRMLVMVSTVILVQAAMARARVVHSTVNSIDTKGIGPAIGTVTFEDTKWGLLVVPDLHGLAPGVHGFHIHQNAACGPGVSEGKKAAGVAAAGHYDPQHTGKHLGPYSNEGHEGDLPPLVADADGKATLPVLAPRLTVKDVRGHSIMIHAGGDNYSDRPKPLGGGGTRIACGVIR